MNLSSSFTLAEMTRSNTATRKEIDNTPPPASLENLRDLSTYILQPLRDHFGTPIRINSGYRCPELNAEIGGSKTSQHMEGRAADIDVPGKSPLEVAQAIVELDLPFDQVIHEFRAWVHVSYDPNRDRRAQLTAEKVSGRTQYTNGLA